MSRRVWPLLSAVIVLVAMVASGCATRTAGGGARAGSSAAGRIASSHSSGVAVSSRHKPRAERASSRPAVYVSCTATAQKPSRIGRCGDGSLLITGVQWSSYGQRTATGTATVRLNSCDPNCATGHFTSLPARVRLSRVATVGGERVFTRLALAYGSQYARHLSLQLGPQP